MRSSKESGKEKAQKGTVIGKSGAAAKSSVKVVDVQLKSKSKNAKKAKTREIPKVKKSALKAKLALRTGRPVKAEAPKLKAKPAPVNTPKPHKVSADEAAVSTMITIPTAKLLRPFRKAAEQNRVQARKLLRAKSQKGTFLAKPIKKGKRYLLDLRVHAAGTAGYFANGGIDPGPALIRLAQVKGLHMIALTEFYDAHYLDRVRAALQPGCELIILPSVLLVCEVNGCREVPILVLLPESATSETIFRLLNELGVPDAAKGRKEYCLETPFGKVLETIESFGAVAIPSRVDKTPYRQLAIRSLVEDYGLHAFDLAHPESPDYFRDRWPDGGFTFFSFSSASALGQIGNRVGKVSLTELSFQGIREIVQRRGAQIHATEAPSELAAASNS